MADSYEITLTKNESEQLWIEDDKGNFIPLTKDLFYYYDPKLKRIVVRNNTGVTS